MAQNSLRSWCWPWGHSGSLASQAAMFLPGFEALLTLCFCGSFCDLKTDLQGHIVCANVSWGQRFEQSVQMGKYLKQNSHLLCSWDRDLGRVYTSWSCLRFHWLYRNLEKKSGDVEWEPQVEQLPFSFLNYLLVCACYDVCEWALSTHGGQMCVRVREQCSGVIALIPLWFWWSHLGPRPSLMASSFTCWVILHSF